MSQEFESNIDQSLVIPNEQDRPSARTIAAALSGAGMAMLMYATTVDNVAAWYGDAQAESQYTDDSSSDFSELSACEQPPVDTSERIMLAAAYRCITYGLQGAELVIVDMTEADHLLQPFAEELEKRSEETTDGYLTLNTKIAETDFDIHTLTQDVDSKTGEQCLTSSNAQLKQIIDNDPVLKAAPYVVIASDVAPCTDKMRGFASGSNGSLVYEFSQHSADEAARVALHEVGHLLGLGHYGQFVRKSGGLSLSYEFFDERDMSSNTLNLREVMGSMTLKEYEGFCSNIMGSSSDVLGTPCDTSNIPALSATQQRVIQWPELALGTDKQYDSVRDLTIHETVITSEEAGKVSGFVKLTNIYEIVSDRGIRNQYDSVLVAPESWGMLENGKPVIRDITLYVANHQTGAIAAVGTFDVKSADTPDWTIELTDDQNMKFGIDENGSLRMKLIENASSVS